MPIPIFVDSVYNISMESKIDNELRKASLVLWDEVVMCARYCIKEVDRTLHVIMKSSSVPSGKVRSILWRFPRSSFGGFL